MPGSLRKQGPWRNRELREIHAIQYWFKIGAQSGK
jgi:hypothetical protein